MKRIIFKGFINDVEQDIQDYIDDITNFGRYRFPIFVFLKRISKDSVVKVVEHVFSRNN